MENKQQSSGFLNGFVIGLLVGVGLALMFTTKKGRRILRAISEEGLDKVSNLDQLMDRFEQAAERAVDGTEEEIEDEEEAADYVPPRKALIAESVDTTPKTVTMPPIQINTTPEERPAVKAQDLPPLEKEEIKDALAIALEKIDEDLPVEEEEEEPVHKVKPTRRRFFRGIPKRG